MISSAVESLTSLFYPQICHCCGSAVESRRNGVACEPCWTSTRLYTDIESCCGKCGALQNARAGNRPDSCRECSEAAFDSAIAAGVYERALSASVWKLKHEPCLSRRAVSVFESSLSRIKPDDGVLVVPVPQSRKRYLERGYNQAEILAALVAKTLRMRMVTDAVVRTAHTPIHRAAMDRKARAATVERSFELRIPRLVAGRTILLVDDVLTSGSTASACASVLKKHGASRVDVVTLARAVMHGHN